MLSVHTAMNARPAAEQFGRAPVVYRLPVKGDVPYGGWMRRTTACEAIPVDWNELKTSCRIVGVERVDEFSAMCAALGLRPHQLVVRLVDEGLARYRRMDPNLDGAIQLMCEGRRRHRAKSGISVDAGKTKVSGANRRHLQAVR